MYDAGMIEVSPRNLTESEGKFGTERWRASQLRIRSQHQDGIQAAEGEGIRDRVLDAR